jgi:hypothetical protein
MKAVRHIAVAAVFVVSAAGVVTAQQNVAAQNSGPSLPETMKYIQDRLSEIRSEYSVDSDLIDRMDAEGKCGEAEIEAAGRDASGERKPKPTCPSPVPTFSTERLSITGIQADASSCSLAFHENLSGGPYNWQLDNDYRLSLRDINAIKVATMTEIMTRQLRDPLSGRPVTLTYSPVVYGVSIKMNSAKNDPYVEFLDEDLANRFAKALNHAAELCGAVDNDPFK